MRSPLILALFLLVGAGGCKNGAEPTAPPSSSNTGSHRAAREAALEVVNDCKSRGFEIRVERGEPACRNWVHYEVHCQDESVASFAHLVCDERDDFCSRASDVCVGDN